MPNEPTAAGSETTPSEPGKRVVDLILMLLTAAAGATDALAYLGLGGVFTANMTGNLVLFGIAGASGADMHLARAGVAVTAFTVGLVIAYRMTAVPGLTRWLWPRRVSLSLVVALALQTTLAVIWAQTAAHPGRLVDMGLVALSGAAMGMQTAAARRLAKAGITTTFVTGTLTSVAEDLSHGSTKNVLRRCAALLSLVAGALGGAVALRVAPALAAGIAPLLVMAALLIAGLRLHGRRS
ncbi:YoaK family protein [Streptomyces sp. NBC_00145]|uniref:YoaK family protein n=1 Tax=Streptomyces sp. NBC_00145 TaxID=2975666 RepID=UPI002E1842A3